MIIRAILLLVTSQFLLRSSADECSLTPVVHVLKHTGCVPKPIPSYACLGYCSSYVQVSGNRLWQTERSCMCCQESGQREAAVTLFCPKAQKGQPKYRKLVTRAPMECTCRPCSQLEESRAVAQELVDYIAAGTSLEDMPFL